jgi:acyl-CoA dehydrogenase
MEFEHSEKVRTLQARVKAFMVEHIYPNEEELFAEVNEGDRWRCAPSAQLAPWCRAGRW